MFKILVPTDYSECADMALHYAFDFVKDRKGTIMVYHSDFQEELSMAGEEESDAGGAKKPINPKKHVKKFLADYPGIKLKDYTVDYYSSMTKPIDAIIELVQNEHYNLVIMGSKGSDETSCLLGSNTSEVIRKVKCPVLAIPEEVEYKPISKIVYAMDYVDVNKVSINVLKSFADKLKAEIVMLHVNIEGPYFEEKKLENYRSAIEEVAAYKKISFEFVSGDDICESIETYLTKHNADMLAMLTRDYHLIEKAYEKSLTRKVLFHCKVPLLAFHN